MLKGTTKIELTNVHTGEVEVQQHDNMITNALNDVLSLNPELFKSFIADSGMYLPIIPNILGGIMLLEEAVEEDLGKYWINNDNPVIGYSSSETSPGTDPKRGSLNVLESGPLEDGAGYRFVFDFSTSQGNGTIAALGLTSNTGGACGYGNMSNTSKAIKEHLYRYAYVNEQSEFEAFVPTAKWNADIVAFDLERNKAFAVQFSSSAVKQLVVREIPMALSSIGLLDNCNVWPDSREFVDHVLTTQTFNAVNNYNRYGTFLYDGQEYIWGFEHANDAAGNSSGNANVNWIKIKLSDLSFEEGTWSLAATLMNFGTNLYYHSKSSSAQRATNAIIHDGYLYCVNYAKTGIYRINLSNPTDILLMEHPDGKVETAVAYATSSYGTSVRCGTVFNIMYDTVYFANGYIQGDVIIPTTYSFGTGYRRDDQYPYGLRHAGKPGLRIGPFLFTYGFYEHSTTSFYKYWIVLLLGNYLATINNLEKPVLKTADKTMKITYILREE